jgi:hypothetical protein
MNTTHKQLIENIEAIDRLNLDIPSIKQECAELYEIITLESVIQHQAAIDTLQTEFDNYQNLIDDQQRIIATASNTDDLTSGLIAQREELLTEIALGGNKAAELKKIDSQLETAKAKQTATLISNQTSTDQAQQTINGLNRRLDATQQRLTYLQSLSPKILDILLMKQATQDAIEFNAMALVFIDKFKALVAIDLLVTQCGQRKNTGLLYDSWLFKIPCAGSKKTPATLFIPDHYLIDTTSQLKQSEEIKVNVKQLADRLIKQGVNLDCIGG